MITMMTLKDFQHSHELSVSDEKFNISSDTLVVEMERSPYQDSWFNVGDEILISDDQLVARSVRINFEKSSSNVRGY